MTLQSHCLCLNPRTIICSLPVKLFNPRGISFIGVIVSVFYECCEELGNIYKAKQLSMYVLTFCYLNIANYKVMSPRKCINVLYIIKCVLLIYIAKYINV